MLCIHSRTISHNSYTDVACLFSSAAVIYQQMGVKQLISPAYLSHTSPLISLDQFAEKTVMKRRESDTTSAGTRSCSRFRRPGEITNLMHKKCLIHPVWLSVPKVPLSLFSPNLFSWLFLLGDKCVGMPAPPAPERKRRLRLRPISPDITNEVSCLETCNVSPAFRHSYHHPHKTSPPITLDSGKEVERVKGY